MSGKHTPTPSTCAVNDCQRIEMQGEIDRLTAQRDALLAAAKDCHRLSGRNGPKDAVAACVEIERVSRAAITLAETEQPRGAQEKAQSA